mgnify:CR=1 FL=1
MIQYISTRGGIDPVNFDEALLQGFAGDGGLFVPETIPRISQKQLEQLSGLCYTDLAFEILCLYIDPSIIPRKDLRPQCRREVLVAAHAAGPRTSTSTPPGVRTKAAC